jgi:hypothetical protein
MRACVPEELLRKKKLLLGEATVDKTTNRQRNWRAILCGTSTYEVAHFASHVDLFSSIIEQRKCMRIAHEARGLLKPSDGLLELVFFVGDFENLNNVIFRRSNIELY